MVDFDELRRAAQAAMRQAYAHYSGFPVGAAALVEDGRIVQGCNIETQLRGLTMCAENTMVGQLALTGGGRIIAFSCVDPPARHSSHAGAAAKCCTSSADPIYSWTPGWARCRWPIYCHNPSDRSPHHSCATVHVHVEQYRHDRLPPDR